jgi:signal transduction histidine kinase
MASSQIPEQAPQPRHARESPATPSAESPRLVSTPGDTTAHLERLDSLLEPLTQSALAMVFLYDPASGHYVLRWAQGGSAPAESGHEFSLDGEIAQWLEVRNHPVYLQSGHDRLPPPLDTVGMVLFMPLQGHGGYREARPRGWVALGPHPGGEPYSPRDLVLLAALVDHAALAIENSQLVEQIAGLDQAKAEFIDFVAHELKQPMTSMQGYTKMLLMGIGGELNDTQSQFVEVINANAARMGKLVNDLLEISRLEAGRVKLNLEPLQPRAIVDEALAAVRADMEARGHTLEVQLPDGLPLITGDLARLLQVLTNLLSNACLYTPDGGTIRVSAAERDSAGALPGYLLFTIADTGIGMSPEDLANLGKFFRADRELIASQPGTGLGLSIAQHIIELHSGELSVESELDRGSTFSFSIPIAAVNETPFPLPTQ